MQIIYVCFALSLHAEKGLFICMHRLYDGGETKLPSEKILEQKKQAVAALTEQLKNSCCGVVVNYSGITVAEDTKLRKELREANVKYAVVKNSLLERSVEAAEIEDLKGCFEGATAIATCDDDYVAAARILSEFAEKNKKFEIKAGYMDGKAVSIDVISRLAKIPSKDTLLAQVAGVFAAPMSIFALCLEELKTKKEEEGSAA